MKHRDLIVAAMDGKTIQWRYKKTITTNLGAWAQFYSPAAAVQTMCSPAHQLEAQQCDFRIQPESVPDKVAYDVLRSTRQSNDVFKEPHNQPYIDAEAVRRVWGANCHVVRLTIKTDEDGVETKIVELV